MTPVNAMVKSPFPPTVYCEMGSKSRCFHLCYHGNCVCAPCFQFGGGSNEGGLMSTNWNILFTVLFNGSSVKCLGGGLLKHYTNSSYIVPTPMCLSTSLYPTQSCLWFCICARFLYLIYYYIIYSIYNTCYKNIYTYTIRIYTYAFLRQAISSIQSKWLRLPLTAPPTETAFVLP